MDFTELLSGDFIIVYPSFLFIAKICAIKLIVINIISNMKKFTYPETNNFTYTSS